MWKLKKRGRCARSKFFLFVFIIMYALRTGVYSMYNVNVTIHLGAQFLAQRSFVCSFVHSFARSLVPYLLPRRRKMRASHLHVKSDKTSARFTTQVMRHFSHFATHPRYTIFSSEMQNCFIFIEKFSDNLSTFLVYLIRYQNLIYLYLYFIKGCVSFKEFRIYLY